LKTYFEGLRDAPALIAQLRPLNRGLLLHGHLHRRVQRDIRTDAGHVNLVGATSASLHHDDADRMAGFNLYEIGDNDIERVEAHVYSPNTDTFHIAGVPQHA
jgi:hypothetical protein